MCGFWVLTIATCHWQERWTPKLYPTILWNHYLERDYWGLKILNRCYYVLCVIYSRYCLNDLKHKTAWNSSSIKKLLIPPGICHIEDCKSSSTLEWLTFMVISISILNLFSHVRFEEFLTQYWLGMARCLVMTNSQHFNIQIKNLKIALHQASTVLWHLATAIVFYANYLVEQNQSGKPVNNDSMTNILDKTMWNTPAPLCNVGHESLKPHYITHYLCHWGWRGGGRGCEMLITQNGPKVMAWKTPLPTVLSQIVAIDEIFWRLVIHISSPFSFWTQY